MKKIITISAFLVLLIPSHPVFALLEQTEDISPFSDVSQYNKNFDAIEYLKDNGIISGYEDGTYKPFSTINRAELLKMLVEGNGVSPTLSEYSDCFPDVKKEWFAPYVCYAKSLNWVSGYEDGNFNPSNEVVKVEALKMLLVSKSITIKNSVAKKPFEDVSVTDWFAPYVSVAKSMGILEEMGSHFEPMAKITRARIAENLYRLLVHLNEKDRFISATTEAVCTVFKSEDLTDPNLEQETKDIYTKFGFDTSDDSKMEGIAAKYENDIDVKHAVEEAIKECVVE